MTKKNENNYNIYIYNIVFLFWHTIVYNILFWYENEYE